MPFSQEFNSNQIKGVEPDSKRKTKFIPKELRSNPPIFHRFHLQSTWVTQEICPISDKPFWGFYLKVKETNLKEYSRPKFMFDMIKRNIF